MSGTYTEYDIKAAATAQMLADGFAREVIAETLSSTYRRKSTYTKSYVSKLIDHAKKQGWLTFSVQFHSDRLPPDIDCLYSRKRLSARIEAKYKPTLNSVKIADFRINEDNSVFGMENVARALIDTLNNDPKTLGISCGRTIRELVSYVERTNVHYKIPKLRVFPLSADIFGDTSIAYSPSKLAHKTMAALSGLKKHEIPDLLDIPSFLPLGKDTKDVVAKIRNSDENYKQIFGDEKFHRKGLVDEMDTVITTVSEHNRPFTVYNEKFHAFLSKSGIKLSRETIKKLFLGEIAGIPLLRVNNKSNRKKAKNIDNVLNTVRFKHLKNLADKAKTSTDTNGVVVIACGSEKAPVVQDALDRGIINTLICDNEIAQSLAAV